MAKLKKCPFCSFEGELIVKKAPEINFRNYLIRCINPDCMSSTKIITSMDSDNTERQLVRLWNKRA